MDIERLIVSLSDPSAYSHPVDAVVVHQTHISAVFLAGPFAYKVKKPVALGFLDFRDPQRRQHFCQEEVRLNRRLAPSVYLGVVPVTRQGERIAISGPGEVIDWAVQMRRLPDDASLLSHLERDAVQPRQIEELARRLARFHASADRGPLISALGRFEVVAENARENFEQARPCIGLTVQRAVFERLRQLTEETLARYAWLIENRASEGIPCETHGDLHADHVYLFPGKAPPDDLLVIDCIEFNERFRFADPVSDVAFLVMDLKFRGHADLANRLADAWFASSQDATGRCLLPFYTAYRAMVRGKVEGFALAETEIPRRERAADLVQARSHWLLALAELERNGSAPVRR